MKSLLVIALLTFSFHANGQSAPPLPPTPPDLVDAYIGYEPMDMPAEPGEVWYHQNALRINGSELRLYQSSVFCLGGKLYASESDGGFYWYRGTVLGKPPSQVAELSYIECDYCIEPSAHTGTFGTRQLPISFPSPGVVKLGNVVYSRGTAPYSLSCPAP